MLRSDQIYSSILKLGDLISLIQSKIKALAVIWRNHNSDKYGPKPPQRSSLISWIIFHEDSYYLQMETYGPNQEYIEAGYATSNRATCKACRQKIEKEAIRLCYVIDTQNFHSRHWYHLYCFELKSYFKDMNPQQQVYNLDQVDFDYDEVLGYLQEQVARLKEGRKWVKKQKVSAVAQKKENTEKAAAQEGGQKKENDNMGDEKDEEHIQNKTGRKMVKRQTQQKVQVKQAPLMAGYTAEEQAKYNELMEKYMKFSVEKLKTELGLNSQLKNGNKLQLAQRCIDGAMLGRIPQCPKCGGGKPRFNRQQKTYKCPGYMDDTVMRYCNKIFQQSEIIRQKWTYL